MKKFLTAFLAVAFLVGVIGCGKKEDKPKKPADKPAAGAAADKGGAADTPTAKPAEKAAK